MVTQDSLKTIDNICLHQRQGRTSQNLDLFSGEVFSIAQCEDCGLGWTVIGKDFDVSPYYAPEYYGDSHKKFVGIVESAVRFFRAQRASFIQKQLPDRPGRILDVGCGRGLMLKYLKDLGWESFGTEFSENSAKHASAMLGDNIKVVSNIGDCRFPSDYFDVVSLWHVLEHLPNYSDVLQEVKRILKPGGILIIEVPNFKSLQARLNPGRWIYLETPRHVFHFTAIHLKEVLLKNGLVVDKISSLSIEYGPFGMIQAILNVVTPIPNFLFELIKKDCFKVGLFSTGSWLISLLMTVIFIIPAFVVGFVMELIVSVFGQGGVIRLAARNSK